MSLKKKIYIHKYWELHFTNWVFYLKRKFLLFLNIFHKNYFQKMENVSKQIPWNCFILFHKFLWYGCFFNFVIKLSLSRNYFKKSFYFIYLPLFIVNTSQISMDHSMIWTQIEGSKICCHGSAKKRRKKIENVSEIKKFSFFCRISCDHQESSIKLFSEIFWFW